MIGDLALIRNSSTYACHKCTLIIECNILLKIILVQLYFNLKVFVSVKTFYDLNLVVSFDLLMKTKNKYYVMAQYEMIRTHAFASMLTFIFAHFRIAEVRDIKPNGLLAKNVCN